AGAASSAVARDREERAASIRMSCAIRPARVPWATHRGRRMRHQNRDREPGGATSGSDRAARDAPSPGKSTLTAPLGAAPAAAEGKQTLPMALPIQRKSDGSATSPLASDPSASPSPASGGQPLPAGLR